MTSCTLQGLDWLLHMYTVGSCPDYRWTYDACSPTASQLVAELDSAARPMKDFGKDLLQSDAEVDLVSPPLCMARVFVGSRMCSKSLQGLVTPPLVTAELSSAFVLREW